MRFGITGNEELNDRGFSLIFYRHDGVGKDRLAVAGKRVLHYERLVDFHALGHVEKGPAGGECDIQRDEFLPPQFHGVALEILTHELAVITQGFIKWCKDYALIGQLLRESGAPHHLAVRENDFRRVGEVG